jgi:hypothetical protein
VSDCYSVLLLGKIAPFELTVGIGLHFSAYLSLPTQSPTAITALVEDG